jgi:hypothetical protein
MSYCTPSDMLCRFFEHDDNRDDTISWSVSGGSLEGTKRYYRIMYDNSITKLERELVVDIKDSNASLGHSIAEFKQIVTAWLPDTCNEFGHQVQKMFIIDPWLSDYAADVWSYIQRDQVD